MTSAEIELLGFEAFGVAVGATLVSGALSLAAPFLIALTGALAALAIAGWSARLRRTGPFRAGLLRPIVALAILGSVTVIFLFPPTALDAARGLILALGLLPLWAVERGVSHLPATSEDRR